MAIIKYPESKQDAAAATIPFTISVKLPDGWRQADIGDAVLGAIRLKQKNEFSPNLFVKIIEDSPASSLDLAKQGVTGYLAQLEGAIIITNDVGTIAGREWHVAEFTRRDKTVGDIVQLVATTVAKTETITYVYRITGTALSVNAETDFMAIRGILASAIILPSSEAK